MNIDITKTYRTRDGRAVTDLKHRTEAEIDHHSVQSYPIGGLVNGYSECWTSVGHYLNHGGGNSDWDLVLVEDVTPASGTLDTSKPVQLRDGTPVRIVSTAMGSSHPIGAIIMPKDGEERFDSYTVDGREYRNEGESPYDLINVPDSSDLVFDWVMASANSHIRDALRAFHDVNRKIMAIKFVRSIVPATVDTTYTPPEGVVVGCGLVAAKQAFERFVSEGHAYA